MNFQKTRTLSSEIFQMLRQIYENQRVSQLEKDILKEKLRHLYEAIDEVSQTGFVEKEQEEAIPMRKSAVEDPVLRAHDLIADLKAVQEDIPEEDIPEEDVMNNVETIEEEDDEDVLDFSNGLGFSNADPIRPTLIDEGSIESVESSPSPVLVKEEISHSRTILSNAQTQQGSIASKLRNEPEVEELFLIEEGKELLDKLRSSPIGDLSKALTLNDKMFYSKELFNNDTTLLNQTLVKLNELRSFDEAKVFLAEEVIQKYGWTSEDKKKTAKEVIRVIKRRYIA